jgi:hypothetical protein
VPLCSALTAKGEPCRKTAMKGHELCAFHLGRAGRKTLLEPDVIDRLEQMLKAGNYIEVALRAVGVGGRTFRDWMQRGRTSAAPGDELYRELVERVDLARAEGEVRNVATIAAAGRDNWQAAAWILERSAPERWGKVSTKWRMPAELPPEEDASLPPAAGHELDPFAEVDELAAKRRARTGV